MPAPHELSRAQAEARIAGLGFYVHDDVEVVCALWDEPLWLYVFCAPGNPGHAWCRHEPDLDTLFERLADLDRPPPEFDLEQWALTSAQAQRKLELQRRMRMNR